MITQLLTRPRHRAARLAAAVGSAAVLGLAGLANAAPASAATYLGGVDMQRACNDQYGVAFGYVAKPLNRYDAYSWRCTKDWDRRLGIDVNRACATQYGNGAWSGLRNRYDAYSWFCQR